MQGAYANPPVNVQEEDYEVLKLPVYDGRLWFVGEYMAGIAYSGLVHGAYIIGREQGERLLKHIHAQENTVT